MGKNPFGEAARTVEHLKKSPRSGEGLGIAGGRGIEPLSADPELGLDMSTQYIWGHIVYPIPHVGVILSIFSMFSMPSILVAVK